MLISWENIQDRIRGCWWGQMAGDALGSQVEFRTAEGLRRQWPEGLRNMGSSPIWGTAPGQITDDTEMAIELLHALSHCPTTIDWDRVAAGYVRWARSGPFDIGGTVRQATHGAMMSESVASQGLAEKMREYANPESKANGALMRQSPLAIWGYALDPRIVGALAREDARLTHPNPVCQDASAVYVATIAQIIRWGLDAPAAYEFALDFVRRYGQEREVLEALAKAKTDAPPVSHHRGYVLCM